MSKNDNDGCGCMLILGIIFFPFMVLFELSKKYK